MEEHFITHLLQRLFALVCADGTLELIAAALVLIGVVSWGIRVLLYSRSTAYLAEQRIRQIIRR